MDIPKVSGEYTVYYHLNKINKKVYFGITRRKPEHRWSGGKAYSGSMYFNSAIKKYGWDGFHHRILVTGLSKEVAERIETNLIIWSNSLNRAHGYNLKAGGGTCDLLSDETREKMSKSHKGKFPTEITRARLSESRRGKVYSEESKKKISDSNKQAWLNMTVEQRKNKTDAGRKENLSKESIKKMSDAMKRRWKENPPNLKNRKKYLCVETGEIFIGQRAAGESKDISSYRNISAACYGRFQTVGGYHWKLIEEEAECTAN